MKIESVFNKKEKKQQYRARFQINKKEIYLTADTKKELNGLIDEIKSQERREKRGISRPAPPPVPPLLLVFETHLPTIIKPHQRQLARRVFQSLLDLLPPGIKITDLKKAHFQKYIDSRRRAVGVQTKRRVLDETIDKELYAVSSALKDAPLHFTELEDYRKPDIPKAKPKGKKRRRTRLVEKTGELDILLRELRARRTGKQTEYTEKHRRRLADDLEFRYETGLRRVESARLKRDRYFPAEAALRDVVRWKTGTVTKFFPLSRRAVLIVENRLAENDSDYIFTDTGEAVESDYRTLKTVCAALKIPYGRFTENGFVPHDLRRSFATNLIEKADVETVRELLGHSNISQTGVYLKSSENRLSRAVRQNEDHLIGEIIELYKSVRRRKMNAKTFVEKVKKLTSI